MHSHVTFALLLAATALQDTAAATFEWDCTKSMQTCNNACYAVNNRLAPGTLTYDADQTKREPRRKDSGCSRRPCKNSSLKYSQFGRSCDEFPFASTREGGAGAILRCVKNTDNSSEGGQLSNFYRTIKDGDKFNIVIRNFQAAPFCNNAAAKNDGGEFQLKNNKFVHAKRALDFVDAGSDTDSMVSRRNTFREYEDEEGGRVLSLSNEPLVNQTISNGIRTLTLVREITRE